MVQVAIHPNLEGTGGSPGDLAQVSHEGSIDIANTKAWELDLLKDPKNRLALAAFGNHDVNKILTSRTATIENSQKFNVKIPSEGSPITHQHATGRCWLFAACNCFRVAYMKKYNLKEFELSQSYLFFWDKLEKANYFLEQIVDTADEPLDGRLVQVLLESPVADGGQWDMAANIVSKYGLVPKALYPDSFQGRNSRTMNALITTKLRENALQLRKLQAEKSDQIKSTKDKMIQEIHLILTVMLGPPPDPRETFTWEFYDKDEKFQSVRTTPKDFTQVLASTEDEQSAAGTDPIQMFSLVNDPRNDPMQLLSVSRLGNIVEGRGVTYVNVEMDTLKNAAIAMLKAGIPVFFGSDVGKFSDRVSGIMDTDLIDYDLGFNIKLGLTKAQRLETGESAMTHAMVLTAVHIVDDKPVRWRVENSWGTDPGTQGWFVMSDAWMDQFTYQVVVDPSFVDQKVRDVLKQKPKFLPLWDPMGALA